MTAHAISPANESIYPNSTNKQSPQSRDVVLAAAHELIRQHGFAGLSMRELARESGLAKATLYHHFQDKGDVIRSVVLRDVELLQRRLADAAAGPGDFSQRLRDLIATYLELQAERGMIVLQLLRESNILEKDLHQILRRCRDDLVGPIIAVIQEGVDSGQARPINVEFAVTSLFGMIHSFVTYHYLFEDVPIGEEVIDHIHDLFLQGLMVQEYKTPDSQAPGAPKPPPSTPLHPSTNTPSSHTNEHA